MTSKRSRRSPWTIRFTSQLKRSRKNRNQWSRSLLRMTSKRRKRNLWTIRFTSQRMMMMNRSSSQPLMTTLLDMSMRTIPRRRNRLRLRKHRKKLPPPRSKPKRKPTNQLSQLLPTHQLRRKPKLPLPMLPNRSKSQPPAHRRLAKTVCRKCRRRNCTRKCRWNRTIRSRNTMSLLPPRLSRPKRRSPLPLLRLLILVLTPLKRRTSRSRKCKLKTRTSARKRNRSTCQ
uniref:(northern house mosquito) hypothetical protein n=1 Tax=Culex pipiens TaxID=7175 RepID=A0A8D8EY41_CULPI